MNSKRDDIKDIQKKKMRTSSVDLGTILSKYKLFDKFDVLKVYVDEWTEVINKRVVKPVSNSIKKIMVNMLLV